MDWGQTIITLLTVLIGSGLIQFFFNRKDKQKEDAKKDSAETIKKEMKDHLTNVNNKWKVDYCDKNAKAINDLIVEVREGLDARERKGKERYDEHHLSIEKMNIEHKKDFFALKEAIDKLTENDTKITDSITKIAEKQEVMADSLVGQAHDRIIFLSDKITERGVVTLKEKATLKSMYEPYKKLGGNGHCETAINYVSTLPVVTDEEAKKIELKIKKKQQESL